jgi:hypothetical protein
MIKTFICVSRAAILAVFLCVSGCETLGDYINKNPILVSEAGRAVVKGYINGGDTAEAKRLRAEDLQYRFNKVMAYVIGNPETTVDELLGVIDSVIDWHALAPKDRILVVGIVKLVEAELRKYESQEPKLSTGAKIALRSLFDVVISTAKIYLNK